MPVKALAAAKSRLADALAPSQRARITTAMLTDVLRAVTTARRVDDVALVTRDPEVARIAAGFGACIIDDGGAVDLDGAVMAGLTWARAARGVERIVFLPADIPLVRAEDVDALIKATDSGPAIVPSRDGSGTNALVLHHPFAFHPAFDGASYRRHLERLGGRSERIPTPVAERIGLDIDTKEDLVRFRECGRGGGTQLEAALDALSIA